jgi:hypothetical protein
MLVDFRPRLPCAERSYVFSALLPANTQAALSGRKARRRQSRRVSVSVLRLPESNWRAARVTTRGNCTAKGRRCAPPFLSELKLRPPEERRSLEPFVACGIN